MIPLSRCSAMRILGFSPEVLEIYMTSREVSVVQKSGEGICCIIMTDASSRIRCFPFLFSTALNVMKTTDRAVTALVVESFFDITLPPLRSSRTIHATLRAVTTTGGQRRSKKYPLIVNDFFMKRARLFRGTVLRDALGIEH